jgi:hypothetical protein
MNIMFNNKFWNFSEDINRLRATNFKYMKFPNFINKSKIRLSLNAIEKIKYKITVLNHFGSQLCKICEPKPWKEEYLQSTKAEFAKLGLVEGEDFIFKTSV